MTTPDDDYRCDVEPDPPTCPHCGADLDWIECYECGGEGMFDWETLQDEDPLWYQPGDTERCEACRGKGGWWECLSAGTPGHKDRRS